MSRIATPPQRQVSSFIALLRQCLSDLEIEQVLAHALLSLDTNGRASLLESLEPGTAQTLGGLLAGQAGMASLTGPSSARMSDNRILQEWEQAWASWHECIDEADLEDGRYVERDHHWNPPWFDSHSLSADLDRIADRMAPLLERVLEGDLDPGFSMLETVAESLEELGDGLPEWFGTIDGEGLVCGSVTTCILRWERLADRRAGNDGEGVPIFATMDRIRRAEAEAGKWALEGGALLEFVLDLPHEEQRQLLEGLWAHADAHHWLPAFQHPHSHWYAVNQALAKRHRPELVLSLCHHCLSADWRLSIPLLDDILQRHAWEEGPAVIQVALQGLLRYRREERQFDPVGELLVDMPSMDRYHRQGEVLLAFLQRWERLAAGAQHAELAAALGLQAHLFQAWTDWTSVVQRLRELESSGHAELAQRFFLLWRQRVTRHSQGSGDLAKSWIPLLADAAWQGIEPAFFRQRLRAWLNGASTNKQAFQAARSALECLTLDLDDGRRLDAAAPRMRSLLAAQRVSEPDLDRSRRDWLGRMGAARLFPTVMAVWARFAALLVPDPASASKSRYDVHADWLAVLHALDRPSYQRLYQLWRRQHRRRRNLWAAIRARGLEG